MEILERFLNEPRLITFINLCKYAKTDKIVDSYIEINITVILTIYPDLLWMVPYNFTSIKCDTNVHFDPKHDSDLCWAIFRNMYDRLHNKKLIMD